MDRKPEHLSEDQNLRKTFIDQNSWDEWAAENAPFFVVPGACEMIEAELAAQGIDAEFENTLSVAREIWQSTLDPETNVGEVLYLAGYSYLDRLQIIDQKHAELLRRCVELGIVPEREQDIDFREQFGQ
jgi:hypothetical protein